MSDKKPKKKKIKKSIKKTLKTALRKTTKKPRLKTKKTKKPIKKISKTVAKKFRTKTKKKRKIITRIAIPKKPVSKKSEEDRKVTLKRLLIKRREEIIKEAKTEISDYIKGETKQLVDTALDDGDWSIVDLTEDISLRQLTTHRENLYKIDEALRKLEEGTYGKCEDCGEQISEERLKVIPYAIYCTDCKEKREQLEILERK